MTFHEVPFTIVFRNAIVFHLRKQWDATPPPPPTHDVIIEQSRVWKKKWLSKYNPQKTKSSLSTLNNASKDYAEVLLWFF